MEFIFAQFSPAVCLPCKQTDLVQRIIALFRVLLYRVSSKKLLKIQNTRSNQLEPEFSFSFDLDFLINLICFILYDFHKPNASGDTVTCKHSYSNNPFFTTKIVSSFLLNSTISALFPTAMEPHS